jgi:hypothetical protein
MKGRHTKQDKLYIRTLRRPLCDNAHNLCGALSCLRDHLLACCDSVVWWSYPRSVSPIPQILTTAGRTISTA